MIVLDASAVSELLLRTALGKRLDERLAADVDTWTAPHLIDAEVLQVLRRLVGRRQMTAERAAMVVEDLASLDLIRHAHVDLTPRVWQLRQNLSAYDATYVALAQSRRATLLTCDDALAVVPCANAEVEVFS